MKNLILIPKVLKVLQIWNMHKKTVSNSCKNLQPGAFYFFRISIFFFSGFHLYGYCLYIPPPPFPLSFLLTIFPFFHVLSARGVTSLRMWPQPISPMMYRICTRAQENCGKPVPIEWAILQSLSPVNSLWKNDLLLSVSICRPRTGGHPSKYWLSAKLLDLGDCLVPDTYHTLNAVGE